MGSSVVGIEAVIEWQQSIATSSSGKSTVDLVLLIQKVAAAGDSRWSRIC